MIVVEVVALHVSRRHWTVVHRGAGFSLSVDCVIAVVWACIFREWVWTPNHVLCGELSARQCLRGTLRSECRGVCEDAVGAVRDVCGLGRALIFGWLAGDLLLGAVRFHGLLAAHVRGCGLEAGRATAWGLVCCCRVLQLRLSMQVGFYSMCSDLVLRVVVVIALVVSGNMFCDCVGLELTRVERNAAPFPRELGEISPQVMSFGESGADGGTESAASVSSASSQPRSEVLR